MLVLSFGAGCQSGSRTGSTLLAQIKTLSLCQDSERDPRPARRVEINHVLFPGQRNFGGAFKIQITGNALATCLSKFAASITAGMAGKQLVRLIGAAVPVWQRGGEGWGPRAEANQQLWQSGRSRGLWALEKQINWQESWINVNRATTLKAFYTLYNACF